MSMAELPTRTDPRFDDILTLADAAAYLRVPEDAVLKLASDGMIPAQRIGGEWRFSRKALNDWVRYGGQQRRNGWLFPPDFFLESPFVEELLDLLEQRLLGKVKAETPPKPGSKEAVLKHLGVFKDDDDLEERLADLRARREAMG
jgi:excisionase family DNA binding protein